MSKTLPLPALTPLGDGPLYQDLSIWLPQLFAEHARGGSRVIEDKTFVRCNFEGPAVLLPAGGCAFEGCDMGMSGGDVRNLLLAPVGAEKVVGAIAFRNCTFRDCFFYAVGFTGTPEFLKEFDRMVGGARA